jgi:ATP-dependent DNA ligase
MTKTIYKVDTTGKARYIKLYTKDNILYQESGVVGGKATTRERVCKAKNVGKKNATTGAEQAIKELKSKVTDKLKGEYFETQEEAESTEVIGPMLAKEYFKEDKKIDWDNVVYSQAKLDGMRCNAIVRGGKVKLQSRDYKEITTMQHIIDALEKLNLPDCVLDGELYAHGYDFQTNMKMIKKVRDTTTEVTYNMYDMVLDLPFKERLTTLTDITNERDSNVLQIVATEPVTKEQLEERFSEYIEQGYEGMMIRHGKDGYKMNGRSSELLKYKKFIDIACEVIDIKPCSADPTHGKPRLRYTHTDGIHAGKTVEFDSNARLSHEERQELLTNKANYIGKTFEVRFTEYYQHGTPRFPVSLGERLDK